jgi:4-aminobutyrate aminotransferase-like enzyme
VTSRLGRGDRLPEIAVEPPGPAARRLAGRLAAVEAPGINTVAGDATWPPWAVARGAPVADVDGNVDLDLTSGFGVAAVGHRHPRVVAAIRAQAGRLVHGLGDVAAHPGRAELAERLAELVPVAASDGGPAGAGDPPQVYFGISGGEAVEIALATALLATGRPGVVAFDPAYHGTTLGALAVTARRRFRQPFERWLHPHVHRLPFGCDPGRLDRLLAGQPDAGAVVVEPIVGREGVLVPPAGWLAAVAAACRRRGALLVADEVFTGFGRTGRLFAVEHEGVAPDLVVCGKALGGGMPIAAAVGRRSLMAGWRRDGEALHTATFVANPVACAAALAVLEVIEAGGLAERAARLGAAVGRRLAGWPGRFAAVGEVRGRGLLWGIELATKEAAAALVGAARRRGVLLLAGGPEGRVAQLVPPLTVTGRQLDRALDLCEEALAGCG